MGFSIIFEFVIFILLLGAGYSLAKNIRRYRTFIKVTVAILLVLITGYGFVMNGLIALAGFYLYLLLIVLGFGIGILAGLMDQNAHKQSEVN